MFTPFPRIFWLRYWFLSAQVVSGVQKMAEMKLSSRSLRKNFFKNFLWVFTTENWTCPQNQIAGFGLFGQFALNPVLRRIFSQKIDFLDFSRRYRPISWGIFRKYFFTFPKIFLGVWTMFWGLYGPKTEKIVFWGFLRRGQKGQIPSFDFVGKSNFR